MGFGRRAAERIRERSIGESHEEQEAALRIAHEIAELVGEEEALARMERAHTVQGLQIIRGQLLEQQEDSGAQSGDPGLSLPISPERDFLQKRLQPLLENGEGPREVMAFLLTGSVEEIVRAFEEAFGNGITPKEIAALIRQEIVHITIQSTGMDSLYFWEYEPGKTKSIGKARRGFHPKNQLEIRAKEVEFAALEVVNLHPMQEIARRRTMKEWQRVTQELVEVLPQYRGSDRFDAKRCILNALAWFRWNRSDPRFAEDIIESAIQAWGIRDLTMRLNRMILRNDDHEGREEADEDEEPENEGEEEEDEERALLRGTGFATTEIQFLRHSFGLTVNGVRALAEGNREVRALVSDQLDLLVAVSPDPKRTKGYSRLLGQRFGVTDGILPTSTLASRYQLSPAQMRRQINETLFVMEDLTRWVGFEDWANESRHSVAPIPRADRSEIAAILENATKPATAGATSDAQALAVPKRRRSEKPLSPPLVERMPPLQAAPSSASQRKALRAPEPKPPGPTAVSWRQVARTLAIDRRRKDNLPRIQQALHDAKEHGIFRELCELDPDTSRVLAILELRYLGGNGIRKPDEVAERLREEEGTKRALREADIRALEHGGLRLLQGYLETIE